MSNRALKIAEAEASGMAFPWPDPPALGEAIEIMPGILWAQLPLPMKLDHINVYLLDDPEGWTIIDTGLDTPDCRAGWEALLAGPMAGKPVRRVFVTHYHPDHIGLAGWLVEKTGAEFMTSRTSWLYARNAQLSPSSPPPDFFRDYFGKMGLPDELWADLVKRPKGAFGMTSLAPSYITRVKHGDRIRIGGRDWRAIEGNGHAPEHICLYCEADKILIAADQCLPRITSVVGVWPGEPNEDPLSEWLDSCAMLKRECAPETLVACGHNEPFTGLHIRLDQLIEHHAESLDRLAEYLSEPRSAADCFALLFPREIRKELVFFASMEATAHLTRLCNAGRAERFEQNGVWMYRARDL